MKWLKRSCWFAAWGLWLWLGVGLCRELPRNLGPLVCRMKLEPGEEFEGFLPGRPSVLTQAFDASIGAKVYRTRHALTGAVEKVIVVDQPKSDRWNFSASGWHGCIVGYESPKFEKGPTDEASGYAHEGMTWEVHAYDLQTGERKVFADLGVLETWHVEKPWMLFYKVAKDGRDQITVLDVKIGERILDIKTSTGAFRRGWRPKFVGDYVAVHIVDGERGRTELRRIPTGEIVSMLPDTRFPSISTRDGKFACDSWTNTLHRLEVFAGQTGRRLHVEEAASPRTFLGELYSETFSTNGRFLASPFTGAISDVETGERRWQSSAHEGLLFTAGADRFEVGEAWTIHAPKWSWELATTYAMRNLADGSLVYRTWEPTNWGVSDKFGLIWDDGAVRRLPPVVDWPLLAICQSALAAPILLSWFVLRWLRLRRVRLAEAAP